MSRTKPRQPPAPVEKPLTLYLSDTYTKRVKSCTWLVTVYDKLLNTVVESEVVIVGKLSHDIRYVRALINKVLCTDETERTFIDAHKLSENKSTIKYRLSELDEIKLVETIPQQNESEE